MTPQQDESARMLQAYRDKHATGADKYKQVFAGYLMAAQEFTERTGQPAPEVLFVLGDNIFKASSDNQDGINLEKINPRRKGLEPEL